MLRAMPLGLLLRADARDTPRVTSSAHAFGHPVTWQPTAMTSPILEKLNSLIRRELLQFAENVSMAHHAHITPWDGPVGKGFLGSLGSLGFLRFLGNMFPVGGGTLVLAVLMISA